MKKLFKTVMCMVLCFSVFASGINITGQTAEAKTLKWSNEGGGRFFDGNRHLYYMVGKDLYRSAYNHRVIRSGKKITSWKLKNSEYMTVVHGYQNTLYLVKSSDPGVSATLCSYNIKTKQKKTLKSNCAVLNGKGRYMYADTAYATDVSAGPMYVWKINGSSVKKVNFLGKHIYGTQILGNKLYYGSYKKNNWEMDDLTVYRCNLNGSGKKKLFHVTTGGKNGQIYMQDVTSKKITVTTSFGTKYEYNQKTKKLKKCK